MLLLTNLPRILNFLHSFWEILWKGKQNTLRLEGRGKGKNSVICG